MIPTDHVSIFLIAATVLLFVALGVAMIVIFDHKARIPGEFKTDPFSVVGIRRDHPVIAFLTTTILVSVISVLIFELVVTLGSAYGLIGPEEQPQLLLRLEQDRLAEARRHFHNMPAEERVLQGKKPICFQCHGDFPHSKEPMVRTLLNMHTQFAGCITCHANPDVIPEEQMHFAWLNYSGIDVSGPPFGTDVAPAGGLIETDDMFSKIVAYWGPPETGQLLELTEDSQEGREFLKIRDQLSDQDREAVKKSFHRTVSPKGRFCTRCHTAEQESYLPFRELGFSDKRIDAVTNLNIVGIVRRYRRFYMPSLYETHLGEERIQTLVGPEEAPLEYDTSDQAQPRMWWERNFNNDTTDGAPDAQ